MSVIYNGKKTSIWKLSAPRKKIWDDIRPITWRKNKKEENDNPFVTAIRMWYKALIDGKKWKMSKRAKK